MKTIKEEFKLKEDVTYLKKITLTKGQTSLELKQVKDGDLFWSINNTSVPLEYDKVFTLGMNITNRDGEVYKLFEELIHKLGNDGEVITIYSSEEDKEHANYIKMISNSGVISLVFYTHAPDGIVKDAGSSQYVKVRVNKENEVNKPLFEHFQSMDKSKLDDESDIKFEIDRKNKSITINRDKIPALTLHFRPSYFSFSFEREVTKDNPLVITESDNKHFYYNLLWFMTQSYNFSLQSSVGRMKDDNNFVWTTDCPKSIFCESPKLVINKYDDCIALFPRNLYREAKNYPITKSAIGFCPAGNGSHAENKKSGSNLQDDMISVFYSSLKGEFIEDPEELVKRLKKETE